uniref:Triosephosphate isomerase (TIM) n=1 Tax=Tetraselmis sp. GSL018 TaxID=582737 RepID=A0A061RV33_9CHLO
MVLAAMKVSASPSTTFSRQVALSSRVSITRNAGGGRRVVMMAGHGKFFVGGNWKCNGNRDSVDKLVADLNGGTVPSDVEVVCAPPFVYLDRVQSKIDSKFALAAQNCWLSKGGAYTGEVAAEMLSDMDVPWVILGHSERRQHCAESNEVVAQKAAYALSCGLGVIGCIGESLEEREAGKLWQVLGRQMEAYKEKVTDWSRMVIAYEPIWAIGTGVVATPEQAQEAHAFLRNWVVDNLGPEVASDLRIIYGGSVNAENCGDLGKREDIDGFLVGGASLKGPDFIKICNAQA